MATDLRKELQYYIPAAQRQTDYVKALLLGQNPEYDDTEERRRLGLTTRDDNGWTDVKKAARWVADKAKQFGKNVYEGATDIDPLLQLGLVNHVFGNDSVLSMYNANKQAEQAREAQREYNEYLREYDRKKAEREEAILKADEKRQRDAEKALLYKQYNEAKGAAEKAAIQKRIDVLEGRDDTRDDYVKDEMIAAYDKDKLAKEYAEEDEAWRKVQALKEADKISKLSDSVKKKATKEAIARSVYNKESYPNLNDDERNKLYADIMGLKTIGEMSSDAVKQAIASHAGKKTGEALDEADLQKKADEAINSNTFESASTPLGKQIRKTHIWVKGQGWKKN